MTDRERLNNLAKAEKLIRDVEFSYPEGHYSRLMLYRGVIGAFGHGSVFDYIVGAIKKDMEREEAEKETSEHEH